MRTPGLTDGTCDWNPDEDEPGSYDPKTGKTVDGCTNPATLIVGTGWRSYHLCEACAALPAFKHLRRRVPIKDGRAAG